MKTNMSANRLLSLIFIFLGTSLTLPSCNLFDNDNGDDPAPTLRLSFLEGKWLRTDGNNPNGNGMELEVTTNEAVISFAAGTSLQEGDIKWRDIRVLNSEAFQHEELGSDGTYYDAIIKVINDNEIEVNVKAAGEGNFQKWVRM